MDIPIEWTPAGIAGVLGVLLAVSRGILSKFIDIQNKTFGLIESIVIVILAIIISFLIAPALILQMSAATFLTCLLYGIYSAAMVLGITVTSTYQTQKFQSIQSKGKKK